MLGFGLLACELAGAIVGLSSSVKSWPVRDMSSTLLPTPSDCESCSLRAASPGCVRELLAPLLSLAPALNPERLPDADSRDSSTSNSSFTGVGSSIRNCGSGEVGLTYLDLYAGLFRTPSLEEMKRSKTVGTRTFGNSMCGSSDELDVSCRCADVCGTSSSSSASGSSVSRSCGLYGST